MFNLEKNTKELKDTYPNAELETYLFYRDGENSIVLNLILTEHENIAVLTNCICKTQKFFKDFLNFQILEEEKEEYEFNALLSFADASHIAINGYGALRFFADDKILSLTPQLIPSSDVSSICASKKYVYFLTEIQGKQIVFRFHRECLREIEDAFDIESVEAFNQFESEFVV